MSEFSMTPVFRIEYFYDAIINSTTPPAPVNRKEFYLAKIAGADVDIPYPVFRDEFYLAKIAGMDVDIPEPVFREEFYLASLAGVFTDVPDPVFREEFWLYEWSGGGSHEIWETITGPIVSFTAIHAAALRQLTVELAPIQDLHGYDNPWPAGGGANKLVSGTWVVGQYNNGVWSGDLTRRTSEYCPISPNVQYTMSIDPNENKDLAWINYNYFDENKQWLGSRTDNGDASFNGQRTHTFTITNSSAKYVRLTARAYSNTGKNISTDDIDAALPQLNEGASVITPWTPYENICPISGHTGVTVYGTWVNVWDEEWEVGLIDAISGQNTNSDSYSRSVGYIPIKQDIAYYIKTTSTVYLRAYDKNKQYLGYSNISSSRSIVFNSISQAFSNIAYLRIVWDGTTYNHDISINYPSTDHDYHPFSGNTYPITWQTEAGTVYSGTLQIKEDGSGVLTGTKEKYAIQNWASNRILEYTIYNKKGIVLQYLLNKYSVREDGYCNYAPVVQATNPDLLQYMWFGINTSHIYWVGILDALGLSTVDAFVTWLRQQDIYIIRDLATPLVYNLTAEQVGQITTLKGTNTIWVDDSDEITVEYLAN